MKVEIFKFHLSKQQKDELCQLKQSIAAMRKDNARLKGELKLFRYYFLQVWREKQRHAIQDKPDFRQELICSTKHLYDEVDAAGLIMEEFGAKVFYLTFNQQAG